LEESHGKVSNFAYNDSRKGYLDISLRFYTDLLGMKLLRKKDYPGGEFTLVFIGYGTVTTLS